MYTFSDFMEHFKKRHYCMKTPENKAENAMQAYFEGVSSERVHLITYALKKNNIAIWETTGAGRFNCSFNYVQFPFRNGERAAFHELGHVVDFVSLETIRIPIGRSGWKIRYQTHFRSDEVVLSTGKTLFKTVREEVKVKGQAIYDTLMQALKQEVLSAFPEEVAKEYLWGAEVANTERRLRNKYRNRKGEASAEVQEAIREQQRLDGILNEHNHFRQVRKIVSKSAEYKAFKRKYNVLLDMLSGYIDTSYIFCGHSLSYMHTTGFGNEFFADVFEAETAGDWDSVALTKQFLPKSYAAYQELFAKIIAEASAAA